MIKLALFDLGKVLIDFDFRIAIRKLRAICPIDLGKIETLFRASTWAEDWDRGQISEEDFYRTIQRELNLPLRMDEFVPIWNEIFAEKKDAVALARNLKVNLKISIVSNTNPWHAEYVRKNFAWINEFDHFIASCDVHLLKPDPQIFRLALETGGVTGPETIYIDDLAENVAAAKALGMDALQFTGVEKLSARLKERGILDGQG